VNILKSKHACKMKKLKKLTPALTGIVLLVMAFGCKKSDEQTSLQLTAEEQRIESIRSFIAKKHQLNDKDVGYDKKNQFFSMYQINVVSYEDALIDYQANKK
jgi:hypothetical protein